MNANSNGVILDSSILIDFNPSPRRLDRYIKGKTIYHIDDIEEELFKHYLELLKNKKKAERTTNRTLQETFKTTFLHPVKPAENEASESHELAVMSEMRRKLELAKLEPGQLNKKSSEIDMKIVAYAIVHNLEVVAKDKLFLVMRELFGHYVTIYTPGLDPLDKSRKKQLEVSLRKNREILPIVLSSVEKQG